MELVAYQSERWQPANYIALGFTVINTAFLSFFMINLYLRLRQVQEKFEWENTLITLKLHNALTELKSIRERKEPVTITEFELKKMRWAIQMLVFTLHYGMPFEPYKACLDDFMNKECHSVRTYAEKYIYPQVFTTPEQMYDLGLEYLYGTGRAWEKNTTIARKWLEEASRKGHRGADTQLRLMK